MRTSERNETIAEGDIDLADLFRMRVRSVERVAADGTSTRIARNSVIWRAVTYLATWQPEEQTADGPRRSFADEQECCSYVVRC